jgi:hypothetical protein
MSLYEFLQDRYDPPQGRRAEGSTSIRIDDRNSRDVCKSFCSITVEPCNEDEKRFTLTFHNIPCNEYVEEVVADCGGEWLDLPTGRRLTLKMSVSSVTSIRRLAHAIRKIPGRGRRYGDSNWKWMCPRTANSLDHFADLLIEYRSLRLHEPSCLPDAPPAGGAPRFATPNSVRNPKCAEIAAKAVRPDDDGDIFRQLADL